MNTSAQNIFNKNIDLEAVNYQAENSFYIVRYFLNYLNP